MKGLFFFDIFLYNKEEYPGMILRDRRKCHMKVRIDEKHRATARTAILVFTICMLITLAVWRFPDLVRMIKKIISVFAPVIWGLLLAYLLSPLQDWLEKKFKKLTDRKTPHPKLARTLSVTGTVLILALAIFGLIATILPELYSSIKNLFTHLPEYLTSLGDWIETRIALLKEGQPQMYDTLNNAWLSALDGINNFTTQFQPKLESLSGGANLITTLTSGAVSVVSAVLDFLLGVVLAVYLLSQKERYLAQGRKVLYALLPEEHVRTFLNAGSHVSYTFMHFLTGKTIDSLIMGLLCFIGMTVLQMPYAALISIFVGVTNIIPFFGPIIGAVPSGLLILLSEPRKAIPFAIFILVLQQFDGNILGPKIIGDSLGLPMFWVLFAISVGGGMFGFIGMVAFIPLFAALYTFLSDVLATRLRKKGLPGTTKSYMTNEPPVPLKPEASGEEEELPEFLDDRQIPEIPVPVQTPAAEPETEAPAEETPAEQAAGAGEDKQ